MGSKTFDGIRFSVYPHDHEPPHVHGFASGVEVVLDLLPGRDVRVSKRKEPILPANAPRAVIAKVRRAALAHVDELNVLWESLHGSR